MASRGALQTVIAFFSIIALTAAALAGAGWYSHYHCRKQWFDYKFQHIFTRQEKKIFLTFDDGPSSFGKVFYHDDGLKPITDPAIREIIKKTIPDYDFSKSATENTLNLLEKYQAKGIFFLLGRSIESCPDSARIIQRMLSDEHLIGNHSFSHPHSHEIDADDVLLDFVRSHDLLSALSGKQINLFRPPYGEWSAELTQKFLSHPRLSHYMFPIRWTDSFKDWEFHSIEDLHCMNEHIDKLKNHLNRNTNTVLLFHDTTIPSIIFLKKLLDECDKIGYAIGEPKFIEKIIGKETLFYKKSPVIHHLRNLKRDLSMKISTRIKSL